jgi:hypothetical protein
MGEKEHSPTGCRLLNIVNQESRPERAEEN